jgi:hypothetical protein
MSNYNGGSIDSILDRMWSSNLYEYDKESREELNVIDFFQINPEEASFDNEDLEDYFD